MAALAALALTAPAAPAAAQSTIRVDVGGGSASRMVSLPRGKSAIVELPVDARDVLVSNPAVADAVLRSPRRIYVLGVAPGQTDAVFFDAAGRQILSLDIRVDQATGALQDTIRRVAPEAQVQVEAVNESVVLTGMVLSAAQSDMIQRLAERYVAKPEQVLNMLSIAGKDQVMLKVRVVEMQRSVIKQLGFDTNAILGQIGVPQFSFANLASFAVNGGLVGGLSGGYNVDTTNQPTLQVPCADPSLGQCYQVIKGPQSGASNWRTATPRETVGSDGLNQAEATVKAFERVGLIRTLAEPNLTAISGESARFLAGGEFPIPVATDEFGRISVEFKPFGVGLGFTPVVLSEGRISLRISTEVSELSNLGAFSVGGGNNSPALTIPALNVRRAETTVELPSGGGMMIAGLLQETTRQNLDSVPGLMNVPVLGTLFRSRDYLSGETELVIMVTPYLVKPTDPSRLQTPADGLRIANDMETVLLGRLNRAYRGEGAPAAVAQDGGPAWRGPFGYVIE
jgi:pilus assembly protein CpaC